MFPKLRMRRLRRTPKIRKLVEETILTPNDLVYPMFVQEGINNPQPIHSMPGQFRLPLGDLSRKRKTLLS